MPVRSGSDDGLRDWVAEAVNGLNQALQGELAKFQERMENHEKSTRRTLVELARRSEQNTLMIERATRAADHASLKVEQVEEKAKGLLVIEPKFATFRQEVQEALQYVDEVRFTRLASQCNRLERVLKKSVHRICEDYRELDNRMTVQALAASTFSLKAIAMDADARTKSLKFLAGEESRVKEHLQSSPRKSQVELRASEEDLWGDLEEDQSASGPIREKPMISNIGPMVQSRGTLGLLDLPTSEVFCLKAMSFNETERQHCATALQRCRAYLRSSCQRHMLQLQSSGASKEILEGIHAEAMHAAETGEDVHVTL